MTGQDLSFAIALAPDWRQVDLLAGGAGRLLNGPLAAALQRGAQGGTQGRLLMARSLFAAVPGGRPLAAGLAVALADGDAPSASDPMQAETLGDGEVAAVTLPLGSGLRLRRVSTEAVTVGVEMEMLSVQYLIDTPHGLLTITMTTPQAARTEEWEQLFDAMALTAELA